MYNNSEFPPIADSRVKYWMCSKCQETFANYRELRDHKQASVQLT